MPSLEQRVGVASMKLFRKTTTPVRLLITVASVALVTVMLTGCADRYVNAAVNEALTPTSNHAVH